jgi:hypothetical protein
MALNAIYGLSRCLYGDLLILGEMRDNKMDGINGFVRERKTRLAFREK